MSEMVSSFITAKQLEGCTPKTLHYYKSELRKLLLDTQKPVVEMTTDDVRGYLMRHSEKSGCRKSTTNNMRRIFSSFFGWLEDEDYIQKSPMRRIKNIRVEKRIKPVFTTQELTRLRCAASDNLVDAALLELLASSGIRMGELILLNRDDINFKTREFIVNGKGKKERVAYMTMQASASLRRYLDARTDSNHALFVGRYGRLRDSAVRQRLMRLGSRAGVDNVHAHKFRRTLATMALDNGMPLEQVQKLLKDKEISEDEARGAEKQLDAVTKKHIDAVDEMLKAKEAELMEV